MKNFNLIERLLSDSHEKQSPQRFARYAAILIMLLTLGVGQMWAANTYILGPDGSWTENTAHQMVSSGISYWLYKDLTVSGQWTNFKVHYNNSSWYGKDSGGNNVTPGTEYTPTTSGDNMYCDFKASSLTYYFFFNTSTKKFMIQPKYYLAGDCGASDHNWGQTQNAPTYDATNGYFKWNTMSLTAGTSYKFKLCTYNTWSYYNYQDGGSVSVSQGDHETTDKDKNIIFTPTYGGVAVITMVPTTNAMVVHCPYQVSYNKGANGTGSNTSASKTWKTNLTLLGATFTRDGYTQDGWSTSDGGAKVYNLSGSYTTDADVTLYPHWVENMSSVSLVASPTGKGTFQVGGAAATSTTAGVTTTRSVTAVPISGYHFVSWSITGGASISSTTTNPTTVTGGGAGTAATLTATFAADDVYSLTVAAGTGISSVTGTTNNIKAGDNIAITATVASGYTWSTWTKTGAGTLSTYTAGTKNQTVTVGTAGDITLTATATETMRTITINGGTAASTTAGVATTGSATAAAPAAGKKFTGWTLGSGVTLSGGALTDRTINFTATANSSVTANYADRASVKVYFAKPSGWSTVYAHAWKDGGTGTTWPGVNITSNTETINYVTYYYLLYYTEADGIGNAATGSSTWNEVLFSDNGDGSKRTADLSLVNGHYYFKSTAEGTSGKTAALTSAWCIKGSFNSWSEDADQITHSAAATGSKSITLTTGNKTFKIYNIVNETWWRFSGNVTATKAATAMDNSDGDMTLTPTIAGPYTFALASLTGTPTLAITYPTTYTVTFNAETFVNGGASHSTSTTGGTLSAVDGNSAALSSGGKVISGGSAVITASKADGYTFIGFYTNAACTTAVSGAGVSISDNVLTYTGISGNKTVYAKFSENMTSVSLVASPTGKGTFTKGGAAVTSVSAGKTTKPAVTAVPATGYRVNTSTTVWTKNNSNITLNDVKANPVTVTGAGTGGTSTLTAAFTPKTYTITLHEQGATTHGTPGDGGTISVTYDATTNLSKITAVPERTGYTFGGYYDTEECDGTWIIKTDTYFNWDGTYLNSTTGKWKYDGNLNLYAKWTANQYTVTLDVDEANKGTIAGATTSQDIYYDDATVTVPNRPTAANGYALDGYYTEQLGAGTKVINGDGTWIASVEGYTDASKHWIHAGDVTLYAYYKKAEITAITFDAAVVEASRTVSFAVTVSPTPVAPTKLCFTVLHSNDNPLAEQPTITYNGSTGKYSFTAPAASGTYKVEAVLRTGSSCAGGTELDTEVASFQVAGMHTVTVRYKCEGEDIKAATALDGIRPLDWSDEITAPDIIGYSFTGWSAGDGVSLTDDNGTTTKTSTTEADIKIKAIYDGYLTANYSKKRVIYFNNTLGWEDVWVYFYTSNKYWANNYGTGAWRGQYFDGDRPYSDMHRGHMTQIEGTNIWYFDYTAKGWDGWENVAFTNMGDQTGQGASADAQAPDNDHAYFSNTTDNPIQVVRRGDHNTTLPMFVPLTGQTGTLLNNNKAKYVNHGYWMNYPENSGYTLKIYNEWNATKETGAVREFSFPYSDDLKMPLKLDVEFNDAGKHEYWFMVYRNDGTYLGNTYTFNQNYNSEQIITGGNNKSKLITSAPGKYTLTLTYHDNGSGTVNYYIDVDFPIALNDYRIIYKDNATWSNGAHSASWFHPSDVITKIGGGATDAKKDTLSFYIAKGAGITPSMKFQYASAINESTGAITWTDVTSGSITIPSAVVTESGVYNFIVSQPVEGGISVEKVEPYTGDYYIRTDCAGNTKWDSYKNVDHLMPYSEYSIDNGGYSHYYCHWVDASDSRKNVKFCIANDYSSAISDTLIRENNSDPAWTYINNYIDVNGNILRNANVRFMWNQSTNVISRAYIDGAQEVGLYFLEILSSDDKIRDPNDHTVLNQISFNDIENWVYEQNIQAQPKAQIKLLSNWGTENTITQYFKGSSSATEQLIGGSGSDWYDIRVIYDFKTNRLIASYIPVDENITTEKAIEADIMFIREHQGDIAQLTFGESGKITKIETAYGVMRFNKWTLNNLSKTYPHDPLSSPASIYERSLFYISFPFRVKLSDVIGFGTYGVHWAVQRYDGAARAQKGHFQENGSFWRWMNRNTEYLEPNQGYLLAIDLDLLGRYSDIWGPTDGGGVERRSERLEIYFPSYGTMPDITNASVTCSIPEHPCTINWYEEGKVPGPDTGDPRTSYNRTIFDSHWNVMSVPTYVNTNAIAFANTTWTNQFGPNFLYTWNANDNTIAATSATGFEYHAMHSYMVQYGGNVTWTARSGSPAGIVASKTYAEQPSKVEFRLELQQDSAMIDRTFVALSNDEETSAGFRFGEDLTKEFNANKANIYTFIADEATAAGNTLPMSDQTTIVPVGVDIKTNGDYTFAIPDGTSGIGVTLIDTENNIRTSLSALSYTVNLTAGTHDGRFLLEIAPIQQTPTDIDLINGENGENGVRKMLIDQQMYIIRDGKIYDARGARVQ